MKKKYIVVIMLILICLMPSAVLAKENYSQFVCGLIYANNNVLGADSDTIDMNVSPDENNHRQFYIVVESPDSTIQTIKYAKKETKDETIDFTTAGTEIAITPAKRIETSHTFSDDGIYALYAKDLVGRSYIYTVYSYNEYPISATVTSKTGKTINITLNSTLSDIEQVKITRTENSEEEELSITPAREIQISYTKEYGKYKLEIYDEIGFYETTYFIIGNENDIPVITVNKDEQNCRNVTIIAEGEVPIQTIKYAKKATVDEVIDFTTTGIEMPITESTRIELRHTFSEDGIYTIYARNAVGNTIRKTIYVYQEFPISIEVLSKQDKAIQFRATGTLSKISEITIGGQPINITPANTVLASYEVPDYGTYEIEIKDELGFKLSAVETFMELNLRQVSSIEIYSLPTKTIYVQGSDSLNLEGGKIKINYDNTTSEIKDMTATGVSVSGFDSTTLGEKTITVTYEGKRTSFNVIVDEQMPVETYKIDVYKNEIKGVKLKTTRDRFLENIGVEGKNYSLKNAKGEEITETEFIGTGAKIRVEDEEEYTIVVRGDTSGDGILDIIDLSQLVLHIVEKDMLEGTQQEAADINEDGETEIVDLSQMVLVLLDKMSL